MACCYFWLLPKTILFFFQDTQSLGWTPAWTVQEYYSFVTRFTLGFGLAFELPVVVLALVRFGFVTYAFMARTRPYAIVLIFFLAAVITPTPDVLTLMAMGLPMCLLYESCIWIAWFMQRKAARECGLTSGYSLAAYRVLFRGFAFVLGAAVGSFLNVCIYRLPLDLSVNEPRRSFCPVCKSRFPGIRIFRCLAGFFCAGDARKCGSRIAFRYFAVELLTALLFLAVWLAFRGRSRSRIGFSFRSWSWRRSSTSSISSSPMRSRSAAPSRACSRASSFPR